MSLIIKHNRAEHTHENEQFRRIAKSLKLLFKEQKWSGILIGNPFNENYPRFRADGILLYDNGLIIIDLKDYEGTIKLPKEKIDFENTAWYTEADKDKKKVTIKAGSKFVNPFRQLNSYRQAFKEIVENEISLKGEINKHRTCALNIFSGPITIKNYVPKEIPFYKLTQETDFGTMLYDYSSENTYSDELASALSIIFNAEDWQEHIEMPVRQTSLERAIEIDTDVEESIQEFLNSKDSGIFVLESMVATDRDDWVEYILSKSQEFEIPQLETWIHSARIGRKVSSRMGIDLQSLYSSIYGGIPKKINDETEAEDSEDEQLEEQQQEIIPIRNDDAIDESAVIILHEAHLVSRSLHQSELLRFGSGRLLEDLLKFLDLENTNRKLICIGDPYSLSYGKETEAALNLDTLADHFSGYISHYRKELPENGNSGKFKLRLDLARSIEETMFNSLQYPWTENDLEQVAKEDITDYLFDWYSHPLQSEPNNMVMVYTNKDARKVNKWVKTNCLKNGKEICKNDLLILNNNINIPDETGFGQPTKLYNGMFLLVESVGETISESIPTGKDKKKILLNFTKIQVQCLSLPSRLKTEVYLFDNYFNSEGELSKEEQIAFRIFVNIKLNEKKKEEPFEESNEYTQLELDYKYKDALSEQHNLQKQLESEERVKTKLDQQKREVRKIERKYKRNYRRRLLSIISQNDQLVNAINAQYGWALTVHKSIGSSFSNTIINADQGENRGVANADYFRWLYSGLTTTRNKVLITNPQLIDPLIEINFEDISNAGQQSKSKSKSLVVFEDYNPEKPYAAKIPESINSNVIGVICELSKNLKQIDLKIESVVPNGDYLTKVNYCTITSSSKSLTLAINNKGSKDQFAVSSIRIERSEGVDTNHVNEAIETLFDSHNKDEQLSKKQFPDDFRAKTYGSWSEILRYHGYELELVKSHKNQDVFTVSGSNDDFVKYRTWYKNSGFFSKIEILEKSDNQISENLKKWLLNGG